MESILGTPAVTNAEPFLSPEHVSVQQLVIKEKGTLLAGQKVIVVEEIGEEDAQGAVTGIENVM